MNATELLALTVDELKAELKANVYPREVLEEAHANAERKTAAESLERAINALADEPAPGYYVAGGKSITSLVGILANGRSVEAKFFTGGQKTLDELVKRGLCVKNG